MTTSAVTATRTMATNMTMSTVIATMSHIWLCLSYSPCKWPRREATKSHTNRMILFLKILLKLNF
jgi:hypothetical protein